MERIEKYRDIIMRVLREWTEVPPTYGEMVDEIIVDREADRYLWMTRGYQQKHKRIHACIVRIDIIDGKLWIQQGVQYLSKAYLSTLRQITPKASPLN